MDATVRVAVGSVPVMVRNLIPETTPTIRSSEANNSMVSIDLGLYLLWAGLDRIAVDRMMAVAGPA